MKIKLSKKYLYGFVINDFIETEDYTVCAALRNRRQTYNEDDYYEFDDMEIVDTTEIEYYEEEDDD